jgi:4'-phosphopantetheinyl transferase
MESIFYLTQTSEQIPSDINWLSEGEKTVFAGRRFPKRRNDWLLGRWTAKQAICTFLKSSASKQSLEIRAAEDGAPEAFWSGQPAGISISISHSRSRSLCAVAPQDLMIGCDLEWIEPREGNFAETYFTPEEQALVQQTPVKESIVINLIWSAKEAALKALHTGLSHDTRSININPNLQVGGTGDSWNAWTGRCLESSRIFYGWWRTSGGFVYTLASDQPTSPPKELQIGVLGT